MENKELGQTGIKISRLCFGAWAIGGHGYGNVDDKESVRAVKKAMDGGINFFDTADVYGFGHSEKILGQALRDEENVMVATKFGVAWDQNGRIKKDCSVKHLHKSIHNSLGRLKREYIDLYQIHWHDGVTPIDELMQALVKLKTQGKIGHIGASNLSREMFVKAGRVARIECAQLPYCLNDFYKEKDIRFLKDTYAMTTIVYGVLGRGVLSGKYDIHSRFHGKDTRKNDPNFNERVQENLILLDRIRGIAAQYKKTASQVVIRWTLQNLRESCILLGMKTPAQVEENLGALGWSLAESDFKALKANALALFPKK